MAFSKTMQNIELTSATLPGAMRDAAVVVADLKATLVDVRVAPENSRAVSSSLMRHIPARPPASE